MSMITIAEKETIILGKEIKNSEMKDSEMKDSEIKDSEIKDSEMKLDEFEMPKEEESGRPNMKKKKVKCVLGLGQIYQDSCLNVFFLVTCISDPSKEEILFPVNVHPTRFTTAVCELEIMRIGRQIEKDLGITKLRIEICANLAGNLPIWRIYSAFYAIKFHIGIPLCRRVIGDVVGRRSIEVDGLVEGTEIKYFEFKD